MENKSSFYESIVPYAGSFLILLGVIRLHTYYDCFNINIISYLDFGEIITSFLDIIIIFCILSFFIYYNSLFLSSGKTNLYETKSKSWWNTIYAYWGHLTLAIILFFLLEFILLIKHGGIGENKHYQTTQFFNLTLIAIAIVTTVEFLQHGSTERKRNLSLLIVYALMI